MYKHLSLVQKKTITGWPSEMNWRRPTLVAIFGKLRQSLLACGQIFSLYHCFTYVYFSLWIYWNWNLAYKKSGMKNSLLERYFGYEMLVWIQFSFEHSICTMKCSFKFICMNCDSFDAISSKLFVIIKRLKIRFRCHTDVVTLVILNEITAIFQRLTFNHVLNMGENECA